MIEKPCDHANLYFGPDAEVCCRDCGRTIDDAEVPEEPGGYVDPFTERRLAAEGDKQPRDEQGRWTDD